MDDDDELNETYEDSEDYDEEEGGDMKPAALPVGVEEELQDDDDDDDDGDY